MEAVLIALGAVAACVFFKLSLEHGGRRKRNEEDRFGANVFTLSNGQKVSGEQLIVIYQLPAAFNRNDEDVRAINGPQMRAGDKRYCIGPGPTYLIITALMQKAIGGYDIEWSVDASNSDEFRAMLHKPPIAPARLKALRKLKAVEQAMLT